MQMWLRWSKQSRRWMHLLCVGGLCVVGQQGNRTQKRQRYPVDVMAGRGEVTTGRQG